MKRLVSVLALPETPASLPATPPPLFKIPLLQRAPWARPSLHPTTPQPGDPSTWAAGPRTCTVCLNRELRGTRERSVWAAPHHWAPSVLLLPPALGAPEVSWGQGTSYVSL